MSERTSSLPAIFFLGILFLFFFQLLTDFIAAIYAFGLLGTSIPVEIIAVLLLFSPVLLIPWRRELPTAALLLLGKAVLLLRVIEPLLPTKGRMITAGLGVACFLLLFPELLRHRLRRQDGIFPHEAAIGLALAVSLSMLLRALGSGVDTSTLGPYQLIGWVLAVIAAADWVFLLVTDNAFSTAPPLTSPEPRAGVLRALLTALGIGSAWLLLYFVFTAPHVLARWTEANLFLLLALMSLALIAFTWLFGRDSSLLRRLSPAVLLLWNVLFALTLTLSARLHQTPFPTSPDAYPILQPAPGFFAQLLPYVTLILFPVIFIDFALLLQDVVHTRPSRRTLGIAYTLTSLYLLLLILAHVFTTTYDYIPVIGPAFRDRFWLVHLLPALVLLVATLPGRRLLAQIISNGLWPRHAQGLTALVILLAALTLLGAWIVGAHPARPAASPPVLTVVTYNVQQGYSQDGQKNLEGQLQVLRRLDPDIIGLQETDTARISGSNDDLVRFFADRLDMYSYYGPKTVNGTFGIALLSRFPLSDPQTYYQYSQGEQVATIRAGIRLGDKTYTIFVTHLGNGGPLIQQQQLLQLVSGQEPLILMGDFNFRPDSEQYRLTTATLADTWTERWPDWTNSHGQKPDRKIDHIFVTPGTKVLEAEYIEEPASDHPAVVAIIEP